MPRELSEADAYALAAMSHATGRTEESIREDTPSGRSSLLMRIGNTTTNVELKAVADALDESEDDTPIPLNQDLNSLL